MKKKGCISEAQIYRNRYIYAEYEILRATCRFTCVDAIACHISRNSCMPHHFLSDQAAKLAYINYFNHGKIVAGRFKRPLIESFINCCQRIRKLTGITVSSTIVDLANEMPAPCVGLSSYQVARILHAMGAH